MCIRCACVSMRACVRAHHYARNTIIIILLYNNTTIAFYALLLVQVTMTGTEGEEITVSAVGLSHFIVSATGKFGPSLKATVECHFVSPTVPKCTFVSD